MHPAACLFSWILTALALQCLGWGGLGIVALVLAGQGRRLWQRWWLLGRRARWLLLTLGLILAYGTPGEAWLDVPWAPTDAGLEQASLHVLRLIVLLGALAWLFITLSREQLMGALWRLLSPLRLLGLDIDQAVVRLALVFEYLDKTPRGGTWRRILSEADMPALDVAAVRLELSAWDGRDTAGVMAVAGILAVAWALP